MSIMTTTWRST